MLNILAEFFIKDRNLIITITNFIEICCYVIFLECAAAESGYIVNISKLSKDLGVSRATISNYYTFLLRLNGLSIQRSMMQNI